MIAVTPPVEPKDFDERCRQRGNAWLTKNPTTENLPDYWSEFRPLLREGFRGLCGYMALFVAEPGTVDHFISQNADRGQAYEWSNLRFASHTANNWKRNADDKILDPFEVQDGWFRILLPSLQMVVTDAVPEEFRAKAEFTLERLKLRDHEEVIRWRRSYYELYEKGEIGLDTLAIHVPLIASAIREGT